MRSEQEIKAKIKQFEDKLNRYHVLHDSGEITQEQAQIRFTEYTSKIVVLEWALGEYIGE